MTKKDNHKRFKVIANVGVKDDLTGKIITTHRDFAKILNEISEQANHNAEMYYNVYYNSLTEKEKFKKIVKTLYLRGYKGVTEIESIIYR